MVLFIVFFLYFCLVFLFFFFFFCFLLSFFFFFFFFFSSRRRHTRSLCDWSSDVCSSDLPEAVLLQGCRALRLSGAALLLRPTPTVARMGIGRGLKRSLYDRWVYRHRAEERRVGKECRSRWSPDHYKKKDENIMI